MSAAVPIRSACHRAVWFRRGGRSWPWWTSRRGTPRTRAADRPIAGRAPATILIVSLILAGALPRAATADHLVIPGSGNPERVLTVLADAFNQQQGRFRVVIPPSTGTVGAIRDVEAMTAHLGRVGRPLTDAERARGLVYVPVGRDPVTFVAGAGVTVPGLTSQQAVDVFSGRITDWKDLGGDPGPIRVIGREISDASRGAINRSIRRFKSITFGENVKIVHLDPQMIALLDRYPTSIGFLNVSALRAARTQLNHLTLDGVPATLDAVRTGRYPMWIEVGLIHRAGGPNQASRAFIGFIRSPAGAAILTAEGLFGVTDPVGQRE